MSSTSTTAASVSLLLNEAEDLLLKFLLQAVAHSKRNTTVRIAGGWVRDKILSLSNDDIDLALDDMVGEDFAALLNDYLNYLGLETKTVAIIQANPGQSKHLVTANIHLDLSGFWVLQNPSADAPVPGAFKYDLDCVNLRAETYADDSRIPAMRFGTALEDALRRDFTINALFFNCMTGRVEDLTGHGMEDLGARLVRTPLPPSVTFLDDPLRILRAVRFASRFDYRLHADIGRTVCSQPAVAVAFACKVSKERVCKEMDGALGGKLNRPPLALWLVFRLGLLDKIFSVPTLEALAADGRTLLCPQREGGCSWMLLSWHAVYWTSVLLAVQNVASTIGAPQERLSCSARMERLRSLATGGCSSPASGALQAVLQDLDSHLLRVSVYGTHRALFWAVAASGLRGFELVEPAKKGKAGKTVGLAQTLMRGSLRMDNDTTRVVQVIFDCTAPLQAFAQEVLALVSASVAPVLPAIADLRGRIGALLKTRAKELWRTCLLFACATELAGLSAAGPQPDPGSGEEFCSAQLLAWSEGMVPAGSLAQNYQAIVMKYVVLLEFVTDCLCLDGIWRMPFAYDGNALIKELSLKKGPQIGVLLDLQFQWLLTTQASCAVNDWSWFHAESSLSDLDKSRCLEFIRSNL